MAEQQRAIIGAILAGGRSSRMGTPKHALQLPGGQTMIEAVAAALRSSVCDEIVVVGSHAVCGDLPGALADVQIIEDQRDHAGPLGGIEALLASAAAEMYLICGCDMPLLTASLLDALAGRARMNDRPAMVVYHGDDRVEPLPCVIRADGLQIVRELLDENRASMMRMIAALDAAELPLGQAQRDQLRSINTPDQLADLRAAADGD